MPCTVSTETQQCSSENTYPSFFLFFPDEHRGPIKNKKKQTGSHVNRTLLLLGRALPVCVPPSTARPSTPRCHRPDGCRMFYGVYICGNRSNSVLFRVLMQIVIRRIPLPRMLTSTASACVDNTSACRQKILSNGKPKIIGRRG